MIKSSLRIIIIKIKVEKSFHLVHTKNRKIIFKNFCWFKPDTSYIIYNQLEHMKKVFITRTKPTRTNCLEIYVKLDYVQNAS